MSLRVIQWGTGSVGRHALRALALDPSLELVGVFVSNPEKVGRDAGELAGLDVKTGVEATNDTEALVELAADCVLYASVGETRVRDAIGEIAALLRSGKNVVSTSMMNLIHPPSASPKLVGPLDDACREGQATLFTNGIDPGFSGDLMPLAALQLCERVESIRVQELADYGQHPDASWALPFGFGKSPEEPAPIHLAGGSDPPPRRGLRLAPLILGSVDRTRTYRTSRKDRLNALSTVGARWRRGTRSHSPSAGGPSARPGASRPFTGWRSRSTRSAGGREIEAGHGVSSWLAASAGSTSPQPRTLRSTDQRTVRFSCASPRYQ
jgi:hypothetical protein